MRKWATLNINPGSRFFGFDTLEGLPESWLGLEASHFSTGGNFPDIEDSRVKFYKGLFQDTLGEFLGDFNLEGGFSFIAMPTFTHRRCMFWQSWMAF
jgi:hypothetical protein